MNYEVGTQSEYSSGSEDLKGVEDILMADDTAKPQQVVESQIFTQQLPLVGKIPMSKPHISDPR